MNDPIAAVTAGLLCIIAGGAVGFQEILMGPDAPNYPHGTRRQRALMFLWSVFLTCRGVEIIGQAFGPLPPATTAFQLGSSIMVAAVHGTQLENQMRQWLPARTHARIRRMLAIATCGQSRAIRAEQLRALRSLRPGVRHPSLVHPKAVSASLAELEASGVTVIPPGETLAAFAEAEEAKNPDPNRIH